MLDADRGLDIGHSIVVAQAVVALDDDFSGGVPRGIGEAHAVLAKQWQFLREVGPIGRDHAPFAGGDDLARMEAEADRFGLAADLAAVVFAPNGAGGILDDLQAMLRSEGMKTIQIGGQANLVDDQNRLGARVIAGRTATGSRLYVCGSTSAKIGVAPV